MFPQSSFVVRCSFVPFVSLIVVLFRVVCFVFGLLCFVYQNVVKFVPFFVRLSVCLFDVRFVCVSLFPCFRLSVCLCVVCARGCVFVWLAFWCRLVGWLCVVLFVFFVRICPAAGLLVFMFVCLFARCSVCVRVCLLGCLFVCVFVCLSRLFVYPNCLAMVVCLYVCFVCVSDCHAVCLFACEFVITVAF